jgi:hypothetical protein
LIPTLATEAGVKAKLVMRKDKGHAWEGWGDDSVLIADWFDEMLRSQK